MLQTNFFQVAHSTSKCNDSGNDFERRLKPQALSGSVVDPGFDLSDLFLGDITKVRSLWQIPSNHAVGLFVSAPLP